MDHQVLWQALVTLVLEKELKAHAELAEKLGKKKQGGKDTRFCPVFLG